MRKFHGMLSEKATQDNPHPSPLPKELQQSKGLLYEHSPMSEPSPITKRKRNLEKTV
jgi:hypothetical protein